MVLHPRAMGRKRHIHRHTQTETGTRTHITEGFGGSSSRYSWGTPSLHRWTNRRRCLYLHCVSSCRWGWRGGSCCTTRHPGLYGRIYWRCRCPWWRTACCCCRTGQRWWLTAPRFRSRCPDGDDIWTVQQLWISYIKCRLAKDDMYTV